MTKFLPLLIALGGAYKAKDKIAPQLSQMFAISQVVATQSELGSLAKMIYLTQLETGRVPNPRKFAAYCRKKLKVAKGQERDTSLDHWGNPYKLEIYGRKSFAVLSAGPDGELDTDDDLESGYDF